MRSLLSLALLLLLLTLKATPPADATGNCEFLTGTDFQMPGGGELKTAHGVATAQACCDLCAAEPGCTAAAWNGDNDNHLNGCYMKGAGAAPKEGVVAGTVGCRLKTAVEPSAGGGGLMFLLVVGLGGGVYVAAGIALGSGGGLRGHPHYQQWRQVGGLVADGVATARGGGPIAGRAGVYQRAADDGGPRAARARSSRAGKGGGGTGKQKHDGGEGKSKSSSSGTPR
jgi:hypothetical protein